MRKGKKSEESCNISVRKKWKRFVAVTLSVLIMMSAIDYSCIITANALTHTLTITGGIEGTDYRWGGDILTAYGEPYKTESALIILTDKPLTISGTSEDGSTYKEVISIPSKVTANLTLDNAAMKSSSSSSPITVFPGGKLNLTLKGNNTFSQGSSVDGKDCPAIRVPQGAALNITAASTGTMTASTRYGAAVIGGNIGYGTHNDFCGSITINGGTLNLTSKAGEALTSESGAAIGSANGVGSFDSIEINGGTIHAKADKGTAIGIGYYRYYEMYGSISITGGTVITETAWGYDGIGYYTNNTPSLKPSVSITGGTIVSTQGTTRPTDKNSENLYKTTVSLSGVTAAVSINSVSVYTQTGAYTYGNKDMVTDGSGKLYLWLPENAIVAAVSTSAGDIYTGSLITTADDKAEGILTKNSGSYTLTAGITDHATVSMSKTRGLAAGETVLIYITPDTGYEVAGLSLYEGTSPEVPMDTVGFTKVADSCYLVNIPEGNRKLYVHMTELSDTGDLVVSNAVGCNYNYDRASNILRFTGTGSATVSMKSGIASTKQRIIMDSSAAIILTLDNISIKEAEGSAIDVDSAGNCTILMKGESSMSSTQGSVVIHKGDKGNTLTFDGEGTLKVNAFGIYNAGIGAGNGRENVTGLVFQGGTVEVNADAGSCAAIGVAYQRGSATYPYASVIINGGKITGNNSNAGMGIGSIYDSKNRGSVTIAGGTVNAKGGTIASEQGGVTGTYTNVVITGGSVFTQALVNSYEEFDHKQPTDGKGTNVYLTTVTLGSYSTISRNALVTSLTVTKNGTPYPYGIKDMYTDGSGRLFLWLPEGSVVSKVVTVNGTYEGSVTTVSTINTTMKCSNWATSVIPILGTASGKFYIRGDYFTPIDNISLDTSNWLPGFSGTLSATVSPENATNKDITWQIIDKGTTEAVLSGSNISVPHTGTLILKAVVKNGVTSLKDYEKTFTIQIKDDSGMSMSGSTAVTYGSVLSVPVTFSKTSVLGTVVISKNADGSEPIASGTISNGKASITYDTKGKKLSIGENNLYVVYPGDSDYNMASKPIKITVDKCPLTVNVEFNKKYYDGTKSVAISSATLNGVSTTDSVSLNDYKGITAAAESASVGKQNVTLTGTFSVSGTDALWYELTQPSGLSIQIEKAPGIASVTMDSWTYTTDSSSGKKPVPVSPTNGIDNVKYYYKIKGSQDSTYTDTMPMMAGSYTVKAVFSETDNYKEITATAEFSISKATPTLSVEGVAEKTYGDADFNLSVTKTGESAVTYSSDKPEVVVVDSEGKVTIKGTGEALITASMAESTNYVAISDTVNIRVKQSNGYVENNSYPKAFTYTGGAIETPSPAHFTTSNSGADFTFTWYEGTAADESKKLSGIKAPSALGTYTLKVDVAATANYTAATTTISGIKIDYLTVDSEVAASLAETNKGLKGWFTGNVTVNAPSGYEVSVSNGIDASWENALTVTADMNGNYTYYLKQMSTGYITGEKTIEVKKDTVKPSLGEITYSEHSSFLDWIFGKNRLDVTVPVSDTLSGSDHISYVLTPEGKTAQDAVNVSVDSEGKAEFTINKDFKGSIAITGYDKAGNSSIAVTEVKAAVEDTAPTVTLTDGSAAFGTGWYNTAKSIKIEAVDSGSGIKSVTYKVDNGEEQNLFNAQSADGDLTAAWNNSSNQISCKEGIHTYTVTATDNALNTKTESVTIKMDTTVSTFGTASYKQGTNNPVVNLWNFIMGKEVITVTVPITEKDSGLDKDNIIVTLKSDSTTTTVVDKALSGNQKDGYSLSFTTTEDFMGTYTISAVDTAGNIAEASLQPADSKIVVDTKAPTVTLTPSGTALKEAGDWAYTGTVAIGISVEDEEVSSGLKSVTYSIDGEAAVVLTPADFDSTKTTSFKDTNNVSVSTKGNHTISVMVTDQVGNSNTETVKFKIYDEPTVTITPSKTITYDGSAIEEGSSKDFVLSTGGSNGTVTYSYKAQGAKDSTYVSGLPINAGSYTIKAFIARDDTNCFKGKEVEQNVAIEKAISTLSLEGVAEKTYGDEDFNLTVTKTGESAVTYSSDKPEVVAVDSQGKVTIKGTGEALITASMAESTNYVAVSDTVTIRVKQGNGYVENSSYPKTFTYTGGAIETPSPAHFITSNSGADFTFTWYEGTVVDENKKLSGIKAPSALGTYTLKVDVAATTNYTAATTTINGIKIDYLTLDSGITASLADTNKGLKGWFIGNVTVNAPKGYEIAVSNGIDASWENALTVTADMNGNYTYYLKQMSTGYITDARTIEVKKDTVKPRLGEITYSEHSSLLDSIFDKNRLDVTVPVSDTISGADHISYILTPEGKTAQDAVNVSVNNEGKAKFTINKDFKGSIAITGYDQAGNTSATVTEVKAVDSGSGTTEQSENPPNKDDENPFLKDDSSKKGWDVIKGQIEKAKEQDRVIIDMNGSTVVPGEVLGTIRGKDITLVFDMGNGITWRVNGKSITSSKLKDVDFGVKKNTNAIPVDVINKVTGERYSMNISLSYDGEFGFAAVLTINMEKKNAGLYANLFYYNQENGKMEFICADDIKEDGNVELTFTHASEYTIVISDTVLDGATNNQDNKQTPTENKETTLPATGDITYARRYIWTLVLCGIVLIIGFGGIVIKKKKISCKDDLEK